MLPAVYSFFFFNLSLIFFNINAEFMLLLLFLFLANFLFFFFKNEVNAFLKKSLNNKSYGNVNLCLLFLKKNI